MQAQIRSPLIHFSFSLDLKIATGYAQQELITYFFFPLLLGKVTQAYTRLTQAIYFNGILFEVKQSMDEIILQPHSYKQM